MSSPWTRFFWSDWIADTAHLDLLEKGAYMKLLEHVYQHGRPLPGDMNKLYRLTHATSTTEQKAVAEMVHEFFIISEDPEHGQVFRHLRAEREMEWSARSAEGRKEHARKAANARWAKDQGVTCPSIARALPEQCHPEPEPEPEEKISCAPCVARKTTTTRFDEFWTAWPAGHRKRGKAKAEEAWKRKKLDAIADMIIDDVKQRAVRDQQWLDGFAPMPTTYLNGKRWEDEFDAPKSNGSTKPSDSERIFG